MTPLDLHQEDSAVSTALRLRRLHATTDAAGHYALQGIPMGVTVAVIAASVESNGDSISVDEVFLEPGEVRPVVTKNFGIQNNSIWYG